jgi:alpha-tubulin suppressor-like RCC1 family protein
MTRHTVGLACSRRTRLVLAGLAGFLTLSCDSTEPLRAAALAIVVQPPVTGQSGVTLAHPVIVEVRDQNGAAFPQSGLSVTASIADGGGALGGMTTQTTDTDGRAVFPDLAISGTVGPRTLRFASGPLAAATTSPISLDTGPAASVEALTATTVQATVAAAVTPPPSVVVKDAGGNGVSGVEVTFTLASGAGDLAGAAQTTNASGIATLGGWTLPNTSGQYQLTATAAGVPGLGVQFTATATPDVPSVMQAGGGGQGALYGSRLSTPVQVRVLDRHGNPVSGVFVSWSSLEGDGTVEPLTLTTAEDGVARSDYRVGTMPGQNIIQAAIPPLGIHVDIPVTALGFTNQLEVGGHTCGLDESGVAWCWGPNEYGQLGDGTTILRVSPTRVFGTLRFRRISTAPRFTCGLTVEDVPYCWGFNAKGSLGDGTRTHRAEPTPVSGGYRFTEISAGQDATCAVSGTGAVYCWGSNEWGELGVGEGRQLETCPSVSQTCSLVPLPIAGGHSFSAVNAGAFHACGLTAVASELYCWGFRYAFGTIFDGSDLREPIPVRAAPGYTFEKVVAGGNLTCAFDATASVYCWGSGNWGAFGNGTASDYRATPGLVPDLSALDIDGSSGLCAVAIDNRGFCWGLNKYGAVGDGTTVDRLYPTPVSTSERFTRIAASGFHTCGRTDKGQVFCWGNGLNGALGVGDLAQRLTPTLARP